ncbi:putative RNA-binding protein [Neolecta irregularis DAH-3]|uniref:Putative RNA-binding protein n=1 Tax=Neolecta irregularis (strain DAH-3) TaxID=1198029 RepID=A0A1U7LLA1_NEOID|nr:putative RNA-binding protein [Neolecta irregularis DAH-3]|eukprot:OLL23435.1 putative RNA-binding protein [Neolecta irregularis DAH-3]
MKELNGIIIDGRTVALDFALLPKDQWEEVQRESEEEDMLKHPSEVEAETIDSAEHSDEEMSSNGDKTPQNEKQNKSYDDCTLFARNLLFETTEDELSHHFSKFGRTGFICLFRPENAKELLCLASKLPRVNAIGDSIMDPQDPDLIANQFRLNGRVLLVSKAVKRDEAVKLKDDFVSKKLYKEERACDMDADELLISSYSNKSSFGSSAIDYRSPTSVPVTKTKKFAIFLDIITSTDLKALGRNSVVQFVTEVKSQERAPLTVEEKRRDRVIQKGKKGIVKQAKIVTEDNG